MWDQGWTALRPIQTVAIRAILDEKADLLISAETAGGKTEAALLPLVSEVIATRRPVPGFQLLYVSPLRALINDQLQRMRSICDRAHVPVRAWHTNVSRADKQAARRNPQGILLITPESLEAFFIHRSHDIKRLFRELRCVVIDEFHALADNERGMQTAALICRLEQRLRRRLRRIGLSATMGDVGAAAARLNPARPDQVRILRTPPKPLTFAGPGASVALNFRTTIERPQRPGQPAGASRNVTAHLFDRMRGRNALVFAQSRQAVEGYAAALRRRSDDQNVPNEFFPHHGSLAADDRADLEARLRRGEPTTAVCTSTLELGIDIGQIGAIAQIRPPVTVSSLRQRLGRAGRRGGRPELTMYAIETEPGPKSHPVDYLHLDLVRSVAMLDLLEAGWCEAGNEQALHLSTLTQQMLSVTAECGEVSPTKLRDILCRWGPFQNVTDDWVADVLGQLVSDTSRTLEFQGATRRLRLGPHGETLVASRDFYAAFKSEDEYRLTTDGRPLGTLPTAVPLAAGTTITLSGRTWSIRAIDPETREVSVEPSEEGRLPRFAGGTGAIDQRVVDAMYDVLAGTRTVPYLDADGSRLLANARGAYRHFGLQRQSRLAYDGGAWLLATRAGSRTNLGLQVLLEQRGWKAYAWAGFLNATGPANLRVTLEEIAADTRPADEILDGYANLESEKYHPELGPALVAIDVATSSVDFDGAREVAARLAG